MLDLNEPNESLSPIKQCVHLRAEKRPWDQKPTGTPPYTQPPQDTSELELEQY